jgi:hypothetical protein
MLKNPNQSMFVMHANITATKRATTCSIVILKSISKTPTPINQSMFVMHAIIAAIKRATMCSIVKLKNTSKQQKKSVSQHPK